MRNAQVLPLIEFKTMQETLAALIQSIAPLDQLEREQIETAFAWVQSGAPVWRIAKPDVPPQHLVSYFVLVDPARGKLLLVDHIQAGLWLPSGGHVEPGEHPRDTVRRELAEELGLSPSFVRDEPLFLTITRTVGKTAGHIDVSLWYALYGDSTQPISFDPAEFYGVRWFGMGGLPFERSDPHLPRFVAKLRSSLLQISD